MKESLVNKVSRCIIITGMSGGGKSTALHMLEDLGYYAIENIPPTLLPQLIQVLGKHEEAVQNGVAAVVDVRGESLLNHLLAVIENLRKRGLDVRVIFLDASDLSLVKRFEETRRRHPLSCDSTILEAINMERSELAHIHEIADAVVDTSVMSLSELRSEILAKIEISEGPLSIIFTSFGFKHGIPADSDYVIDVRFLPNPFYESSLRSLSGKDKKVQEFITSSSEIAEFIKELSALFERIFNLYRNTGKNLIHIAVGCTGGRHRSVAVAEWLGFRFPGNSLVRHRDIEKETVL
ncbi:MAG: RNase adapter RapZ [Thermovirgaceae bacterium]|nr:RNase adapter RapZ [Thermovirgaceae bacterium]